MALNFETSATSTPDLTTYTFSSQDIGTASSTRVVVVGVIGGDVDATFSVSTLTVGGVSATQADGINGGLSTSELWYASVPTGTTADIVITWSEPIILMGIGVWSIDEGISSVADTDTVSLTNNCFGTLNVLEGDYVIGVAGSWSFPTFAWSGGTERFEDVPEGQASQSGADATIASDDTTYDFDCTITSGSNQSFVCAAFRPAVADTGFNPGRPMMITG